MKESCCGTCSYHKYTDDGWVCENNMSEYYTCYTEYTDSCDEWEER